MLGVELFDVATSNCSTWRGIVRRGVEFFDVASNPSMLDIEQQVAEYLPFLLEGSPFSASAPASREPDPRTAKPCLGRLHFFVGDVESQATLSLIHI